MLEPRTRGSLRLIGFALKAGLRRRSDRAVECTGLENRRGGNSTVGSNPTSSAIVDADLANNCANWQWIAGCGADEVPYFRIFNPVVQGLKFDPDGCCVRRYIPEIAKLPDKFFLSVGGAGRRSEGGRHQARGILSDAYRGFEAISGFRPSSVPVLETRGPLDDGEQEIA